MNFQFSVIEQTVENFDPEQIAVHYWHQDGHWGLDSTMKFWFKFFESKKPYLR